jgi:DNA-binding NtrC family response regulator
VTAHRILLADPDDRLLATHRTYLAQNGYLVAACSDALQCADLLRSFRPDLLVLDPDLPWGQGEGVLSLMADGDLPAVPVVVLTRGPCPEGLAPAGRYPVWSVLAKPVPPGRLADNIRWAFAAGAGYNHVPPPACRLDPWAAGGAPNGR